MIYGPDDKPIHEPLSPAMEALSTHCQREAMRILNTEMDRLTTHPLVDSRGNYLRSQSRQGETVTIRAPRRK